MTVRFEPDDKLRLRRAIRRRGHTIATLLSDVLVLDANDDRFGRCDVCGLDLGLPSLDEMPWPDRCAAHATI